MSHGNFLYALTVLVLSMATSAYAGKIELTTYYPAPYGEYKDISAYTLKIGSGGASIPQDGVINFSPQASKTDASGTEGDVYYDASAHNFKYKNNAASGWQDLGGRSKLRSERILIGHIIPDNVEKTWPISFPSGSFTSPPVVLVQMEYFGPGDDGWRFLDTGDWSGGAYLFVMWVWVRNITKDGFDLVVRTNWPGHTVNWQAYCNYIAFGM